MSSGIEGVWEEKETNVDEPKKGWTSENCVFFQKEKPILDLDEYLYTCLWLGLDPRVSVYDLSYRHTNKSLFNLSNIWANPLLACVCV